MMDTSSISQAIINRFGLSQVHTPAGEALVDVFFVHGLHGHPYYTWASEKSKNFWPGQLLPLAVEEEKARILVYGYDADVTSFTDGVSRDKIHNHAEHLVAELAANRRGQKATERPLVFVAHSLGGLVVKRALIYSSEILGNKTEHLRSIFISTYGILFFGTPHRGSDIAEWGSRLEWICGAVILTSVIDTQPQLINALKANSETLQNIDRQFIQLASRFHIYFFHEGKPTDLKGTLRYIVNEESAAPNIQDVERACIQQDHSHMCKFESDSAAGFHIVKDAIQRYASQALATVVSRWSTEKAEQQRKKQAQADELLRVSLLHVEDTTLSRSTSLGSSKASKPLFLVPFGRDKLFINRVDIFTKINKYIDQYHRVALSGIGGIGKSQIAIEYCYRFQDDYPHAQVFWVHASTKQRFEQAYRDIARRLQLPGWNNPNIDTLRLVSDWFDEAENESWLMVLDNADDLDTFFARPISTAHDNQTTPLNSYLPQSSRGSMLITTRDERLAKRLAGMHASIAVSPMSPQEAQKLLENWQTNGPDSLNKDPSRHLLEALGYIPLAITQAAAFISENPITLSEYLETFLTSDSDVQDLLIENIQDPRRDPQSDSSIIKTWKISFDMIRKQKPRAAEMLSLMAVLDRQGIPESLLRHKADRKVETTTALGTLKAFSLVSAGVDGTTYEIHRLVQLATQKWLEMQGEIQVWQEKALLVVADMFPSGEFENWTTCESLLPHTQKVIQYRNVHEKYPLEFSLLLSNMACFDLEQGRYEMACSGFLAAFDMQRKVLGMKHNWTLASMHNLAITYSSQGRQEEAEKLKIQVLELRKGMLGAEHPETLNSINNLANTYREQGRLEEAEKLQMQHLEVSQRVLGAEHPETLTSINSLAVIYQEQLRWEEAEKLQLQHLKVSQRVLGAEHPDTLGSINNLALTYQEQGRLEKAEKLQTQVIEIRKRVLGAEHPKTLGSINNLAYTYQEQRRWEEAEKLQLQHLEVSQRVLGAEHPKTLGSINNLAYTYQEQRRWEEAEKLQMQHLEVSQRVLGAEHPDTLLSAHSLAITYQEQGLREEAEELQVQLLEVSERVLGAEHPRRLISMNNLATMYQEQGRLEEAEKLQTQVIEIRKRVLGAEHPDTLLSAHNLAITYGEQGLLEETEKLQMQVLEIRRRVLGAEHPDTLGSINNLAYTYQEQGRWEEAEKLQMQHLEVSRRVLGAEHPDTLHSIQNLAHCWNRQDRHSEAIALMESAVELRTKVLGANHPDTKNSASWLKVWLDA